MSNTRLYFYTVRAKKEYGGPAQRINFFSAVSHKSVFKDLEKDIVSNSSEENKQLILADLLYRNLKYNDVASNSDRLLHIIRKYTQINYSIDDRFFTTRPLIKQTKLEEADNKFVLSIYREALQFVPNQKKNGCTIL